MSHNPHGNSHKEKKPRFTHVNTYYKDSKGSDHGHHHHESPGLADKVANTMKSPKVTNNITIIAMLIILIWIIFFR